MAQTHRSEDFLRRGWTIGEEKRPAQRASEGAPPSIPAPSWRFHIYITGCTLAHDREKVAYLPPDLTHPLEHFTPSTPQLDGNAALWLKLAILRL